MDLNGSFSEVPRVKQESNSYHRKSGGRPLSEGWALYNFTRLESRGAQCGRCHAIIKNTSNSRMVAHYKRCSMGLPRMGGIPGGPGRGGGQDIQSIIQNKIELDDSDDGQAIGQPSILWTSHNSEGFEDESAEVNHAIDIINGDIDRHRKPTTKKRPRPQIEFSNFQSFDAAISSFLIGCNLTFDVVDSIHFKNFVRYMNPGLPVPTSKELRNRVLTQLKSMQNSASLPREDDSDSD